MERMWMKNFHDETPALNLLKHKDGKAMSPLIKPNSKSLLHVIPGEGQWERTQLRFFLPLSDFSLNDGPDISNQKQILGSRGLEK